MTHPLLGRSLDFEPLPILPKFRRIVNEKHGKMNYEIHCDAIDPISLSERKAYEATETANIQLRKDLGAAGIDTSILDSGEFDQPKTTEELAMKMEFSYKHNTAIDIEKRIALIFNENRVNDFIMPSIRRDLFECGVAIGRNVVDPVTGKVIIKKVRAENYVCSPFINEDGSDITYHGEIVYYSPLELQRLDPELSDDDLRDIVSKSVTRTQGMHWIGDEAPYDHDALLNDQYRIAVLEIEYKTTDRHAYQLGERDGMPFTTQISHKKARSRRYKDSVEYQDSSVWRKGSWIVGTEYAFDIGPVEHQVTVGDEAQSSFIIFAPELLDMETWSICDQVKPIVKRIQFSWLKLQNAINRARPKGILIELSSLEDIDLGSGEEMTPLDVMDLYEQTGNLVYRRQNFGGEYANGRPIDELQNGIGTEAQEWFAVLQNMFGYLRDMLGINEITDGSTPAPRTGKAVAEMADMATSNAVYFLLRAEKSIYERLAMSVAIRSEDAIFLGLDDHYSESLGAEHIKSMNEYNEQIVRTYGYRIVEEQRPELKQQFMMDLMEAVKNKEITMAEKVIIESIPNINQAKQRLAYAVKVRAEQLQKEKQEDMKAQSQHIMDQTNAAAEKEERTMRAKGEAEIARERVIGEEERKTLEHKYKMEKKYGVSDNKGTTGVRGDYNGQSSKKKNGQTRTSAK